MCYMMGRLIEGFVGKDGANGLVIGDLFLSLNYGGFFTLQVCHGCDESPCVSCGELVCDFSSMKVMKWAKISNGLQK